MMIILAFLFSTFTWAADCTSTKVKIIFNGKEEISEDILCKYLTPDKMLFYVSKTCLNSKCSILQQKPRPLYIENYKAKLGSPGFKLCFALEGIPQIFEFKNSDGQWSLSERCLFGKDDFVEISLLTYQWKNHIINRRR